MNNEALIQAVENVRDALALDVPCVSLMKVLKDALDAEIEADAAHTRAVTREWLDEIFGSDEASDQ